METAYPPSIPSHQNNYTPMTIGNWIVTQLVLMIPLVGIVMLFVWAFSNDTQPSKKSYCQAMLVFFGCIFALGIVIAIAGAFSERLRLIKPTLQQ